ncbi:MULTISPECIES: phytoene/squalene synthase family protein [Flavobacterium]|uniref:Phytoene/squalene synthase family protein n=1 Tax=Flavobacterium gawalongense TaxID=2594432 RepID=A0A553BL68_9FLAO|nr:phytoene/squalene synthase family protein [Flavobacterium gawalongense]TRX00387.1 phytoene/squalene synthase family protein [Flavobacterium gawalongense]TRX05066.1 phytoene/squalene synthase family protein [Flavobacterium gawalongense]TRX08985.1 phytoene/squalene synthase family protein [Flavobacterium gawalongense]TRX10028.1 phytoene/squalene synthase family protein [Flavobacterium gawalongense]TRX26939.1 phytoene/squalene synthase family protein [Flavobacterium gawalongense]
MKQLFDDVSFKCSKLVTKNYSTSFSLAVYMLSPIIRDAIYSIYGFVRFADEIVDSFHGFDKENLINDFEKEYYKSYNSGISLNPILNSFQHTVKKYNITDDLIQAFLKSMKLDLVKSDYNSKAEYEEYIYGSADVVGLMCLKVFVAGKDQKYEQLKDEAMRLGSAFQKVNFLRDLRDDNLVLNRNYFPGVDLNSFDENAKKIIIKEIQEDFNVAYKGILKLPIEAKFGVYTAFVYYKKLLKKLENTPCHEIGNARIRVSNYTKAGLLAQSFVTYKLKLV